MRRLRPTENYIKREQQLIIRFLKIIGLSPGGSNFDNKQYLLILLFFTFNTYCGFLGFSDLLHTPNSHLDVIHFLLFVYVSLLIVNFKLHKNLVSKLFNSMAKNWHNFKYLDQEDKQIMCSTSRRVRKLTIIIVIVNVTAGSGTIFNPIMAHLVTGQKLTLMWSFWWPLREATTPTFYVVYLMQTASVVITGVTIISVYGCTVLLTLHCCGQIQILCSCIKNYSGQRHLLSDDLPKVKCGCLKCIVEMHLELAKFVKLLDKCISPIILMELFENTVAFCLSSSAIIENFQHKDIAHVAVSIMHLAAYVPVLFGFFWLGEKLIEMSNSISEMACSLKWYQFDRDESLFLMMILNYTRQPLSITTGGYLTVSLQMYKNWITTAMSYLSVLIAVKSGH